MRSAVGLGAAAGAFLAAFVLHILAGAADLGPLFALAVAATAGVAAFFPVVAVLAGRPRTPAETRVTLALGFAAGAALSAGVLWAANDRAWALWTVPVALAVAYSSTRWAARLAGSAATAGGATPP